MQKLKLLNNNISKQTFVLIISLLLMLPSILFSSIKTGTYTCYTGDKVSKFTLATTNNDINLLYEKKSKRYKGTWINSFDDAELTILPKRTSNFSASKPITIEYLISPSLSLDLTQFIIYKMVRGKKRLFCYATGMIKVKDKNTTRNIDNNKQQIIINNNINYNREK